MINIVVVGKIKEKYIIDGINDYKQRLSKYTKLNIIEVEDEAYDIKKTCKIEAENILKKIDLKSYIVILDIDGKEMSSIDFSKFIEKSLTNYSDITFIIGGSYGLDKSIKEIANFKLSFSKMTFPHQLFRLVFLEQLYRSFKIINNEIYHK